MEKTLQKIPFLRLSIAFAAGIILASNVKVSLNLILGIVLFLFSLLVILNKYYRYNRAVFFGTVVFLLFCLLGNLSFKIYNKSPAFYTDGIFLATVLEAPQEKANSYKSVIKIEQFSEEKIQVLKSTNEKILVYFEPSDKVKNLTPGDKILFSSNPQFVKNNGNPFEFDYKKYLNRKKIFRQVYLRSANWQRTNIKSSTSPIILAEKTRNKLLDKYREQKLGRSEFEILSALTLGYKRELDPEIKRVFSSAGAMHVLAVSGLHVGIIYWILITFLGFLKRKRLGRMSFAIISISSLWIYAFITGLSPSVMRAATMFSFFIIGESLNKHGNIYNSLAASALLLLIINPNNLFEVGFQLSYAAVFGIVFLQPKLNKIFTIQNKFFKFFWDLLTVSVAAQIVTFPISVFYFNQFPSYFFISNLFVIPAAFVLIPLGVLLLAFSSIPIIAVVISTITNFIVSITYFALRQIESLPFAVSHISISPAEFIFTILFLLLLFLFLQNRNLVQLKFSLCFLLLFFSTSFIQKIQLKNRNILLVYNSSQNAIIHLISGRENYVISKKELNEADYEYSFAQNTAIKMNLKTPQFRLFSDTIKTEDLFLKNGIINFKGKIILFGKPKNHLPVSLTADYIINPYLTEKDSSLQINSELIILNQRYFPAKFSSSNKIFNVAQLGAYQKNW